MFRTFVVPLTSTYTSIWSLLVTAGFCDPLGNMLVSAVKNDAIIPDRVSQLDVRPSDASSALTVTYRDQQADPGTEQQIFNMSKRSDRNTICLRDYLFAESTSVAQLVVEIESV